MKRFVASLLLLLLFCEPSLFAGLGSDTTE